MSKDTLLKEHLELLLPGLKRLTLTEYRRIEDDLNKGLLETPFMFFIFGDGLQVVPRQQMIDVSRALFNVDCFQDNRV